MVSDKNYLLQIKVKNAQLMRAMRKQGYNTAAELSRATGVGDGIIGALLNLKKPPTSKLTGDWLNSVIKISECLNTMPIHLFPRDLLTIPRGKGLAEVEVNLDEMLQIESSHVGLERKVIQQQTEKTILNLADELAPRVTRVIRMRYGINCNPHSLDQCAEELGVTRERVRQIEAKGLWDLKSKIKVYNKRHNTAPLEWEYR